MCTPSRPSRSVVPSPSPLHARALRLPSLFVTSHRRPRPHRTQGYLDNELVLLRLLLVSHDPDVVFVPSRVLGTKDGGSRRANAILAALTAAAEDDENNTAVRETGGENDNDGAPRVDHERRRVIVPLPSHAFERIDVCVAAIREACALPDDAAVHARVSLDAPRHDFLFKTLIHVRAIRMTSCFFITTGKSKPRERCAPRSSATAFFSSVRALTRNPTVTGSIPARAETHDRPPT